MILNWLKKHENLFDASRHTCMRNIIHRSLVMELVDRKNTQRLMEVLSSVKKDEELTRVLSKQTEGKNPLNNALANKDWEIALILIRYGAKFEEDSIESPGYGSSSLVTNFLIESQNTEWAKVMIQNFSFGFTQNPIQIEKYTPENIESVGISQENGIVVNMLKLLKGKQTHISDNGVKHCIPHGKIMSTWKESPSAMMFVRAGWSYEKLYDKFGPVTAVRVGVNSNERSIRPGWVTTLQCQYGRRKWGAIHKVGFDSFTETTTELSGTVKAVTTWTDSGRKWVASKHYGSLCGIQFTTESGDLTAIIGETEDEDAYIWKQENQLELGFISGYSGATKTITFHWVTMTIE